MFISEVNILLRQCSVFCDPFQCIFYYHAENLLIQKTLIITKRGWPVYFHYFYTKPKVVTEFLMAYGKSFCIIVEIDPCTMTFLSVQEDYPGTRGRRVCQLENQRTMEAVVKVFITIYPDDMAVCFTLRVSRFERFHQLIICIWVYIDLVVDVIEKPKQKLCL